MTISQNYLIKYSTCFGQVHCPSSGVSQHCIQATGICHASSDGLRRTSSANFERKIFGRIYGPKYENGEWKSRTNRELEEMSKGENIVKRIKGRRISWLGHLERMEEDRMPRMIFTQELEGTRRRGRPRKRWKEEV